MARVGLLLIATGKYDIFLKPLIDSAEKFFFPGEMIDIYLFSDNPNIKHFSEFNTYLLGQYVPQRINIKVLPIEHYPFPRATLYRYMHFDKYKEELKSDYLFYLDVDMKFVGLVGEEILPDSSGLTATLHPGFWKGGGSWCKNKASLSYTENCVKYYAGGFQGGERNMYLKVCQILKTMIAVDEQNNIMADWHDESFWNWYLSCSPFKELDPGYCFPEAGWAKGMPFVKRIIALDKDHAKIRK